MKERLLCVGLAGPLLFVPPAGAARVDAASPAGEERGCAEAGRAGKRSGQDEGAGRGEVEREVRALLCRAQGAEEQADWHEKRARHWEEVFAFQNAMPEPPGGHEPLAAFSAETHRRQKQKRLREAMTLRQKAQLLAAGQGSR